jgi:hypothetical protein
MAALLNQLGIDKLSVADRLTLIDQIWESLDAEDGTFDVPGPHLSFPRKPESRFGDCCGMDDVRNRLEQI